MNIDDIKIVSYNRFETKRFSYWIKFMDLRRHDQQLGRKGRLNLIKYLESQFGKVGTRWQYQKDHNNTFILRFDKEQDLLIFLLKFKRS